MTAVRELPGAASPPRPATLIALCWADWRKLRGRGLLAAVLLFGACHGLVAAALIKGMEVLGNKFAEGRLDDSPADPLDLSVAAEFALNLAVFPINGFALLLLFAILWAEDFSLGTMAMIFSRPVARWRVFAAKTLVSVAVGTLSILLAVTTGLVLGLFLFGIESDVTLLEGAPLVDWMSDLPGLAERLLHVFSGILASIVLLLPAIAVAALMGSLSRSPVITLFGSVLLLCMDFFVHSFLSIWAGVDVTGREVAQVLSRWTIWGGRDLFAIHGTWAEAWNPNAASDPAAAALAEAAQAIPQTAWGLLGQPLAATMLYSVVLGSVALLLFCRRDVT